MATQVVEKYHAIKKVEDSHLFLKRLTGSTNRQLFEELWKNGPDHGEGFMRFHFGTDRRGKFLEVFNPVKKEDFTDFETFFTKTFASYGHLSKTQFGEGTTTFMLRQFAVGFGDLFITSLNTHTHVDDKGIKYFLGIDWAQCSHCAIEYVIENHPEWLDELSETEKKAKYIKNPLYSAPRTDGFLVRIYLEGDDEKVAMEALDSLTFIDGKFRVFHDEKDVTKSTEIKFDALDRDSFYDSAKNDYLRYQYKIEPCTTEESDGIVYIYWVNGRKTFLQRLAVHVEAETVIGGIYITDIRLFANESRIELSKDGMQSIERLIKNKKEKISGESARLVLARKKYADVSKSIVDFVTKTLKISSKLVREHFFTADTIEKKARELIKATNFCEKLKSLRGLSTKLDKTIEKLPSPEQFVDPLNDSPKVDDYCSDFRRTLKQLGVKFATIYPDLVVGLIIDSNTIVGELFLGDAMEMDIINVAEGYNLTLWKVKTWQLPFPILLRSEVNSRQILGCFFEDECIAEIGEDDLKKYTTTKTEVKKSVSFDHISALDGFEVEPASEIATESPKTDEEELQPSDSDDDAPISDTTEASTEIVKPKEPVLETPKPVAEETSEPEPIEEKEIKKPETMDLSKISYAKTKAIGKKAPKDIVKTVFEGATYPIGVIYDPTFFNAKIPMLFESEKQYNGYYGIEGRKVGFRGKIKFRDYLAFRIGVQKVMREMGWKATVCPIFTWQPDANFTSFVNKNGLLCLNIAKCPNFIGKGSASRRTFWFIIRIARALAKYQHPYNTTDFDSIMTNIMDTMIANKIADAIQEIFGCTNEDLKTIANNNDTKYGETEDETDAIVLEHSYPLDIKVDKDKLAGIDKFGVICSYEFDGYRTIERRYKALMKGATVTIKYKDGAKKRYVYNEVWEEVPIE